MVQPIINTVSNFDATEDHTFKYTYLGFESTVTTEMSIREDKPNSTAVYDDTWDSFDKIHVLQKNTLSNGHSYLAKLRVKIDDSHWSEWSAETTFMCFDKPHFTWEQIGDSKFIYTNQAKFSVIYTQAQSEPVEKYQFTLLDERHNTVNEYPVRVPDPLTPFRFTEDIGDLKKGKLYYLKCKVITKHDMIYETIEEFIPQYIVPTLSSIVQPKMIAEDGQVSILMLLKQILGTPAKPYIPNRATDSDYHYSYWKNDLVIIPKDNPLMFTRLGMAKASDFVAKVWCQNVGNGLMLDWMTRTDEKNPNGLGPKISFYKHNDYITAEKTFGKIKSRTRSNIIPGLGRQPFYLYIKVQEYRIEMYIEKIPQK